MQRLRTNLDLDKAVVSFTRVGGIYVALRGLPSGQVAIDLFSEEGLKLHQKPLRVHEVVRRLPHAATSFNWAKATRDIVF